VDSVQSFPHYISAGFFNLLEHALTACGHLMCDIWTLYKLTTVLLLHFVDRRSKYFKYW